MLREGAGRRCRDGTHFTEEVGVGRKLRSYSSQPCPPGLTDRTLLGSQGNQRLSHHLERGADLPEEGRAGEAEKAGLGQAAQAAFPACSARGLTLARGHTRVFPPMAALSSPQVCLAVQLQ